MALNDGEGSERTRENAQLFVKLLPRDVGHCDVVMLGVPAAEFSPQQVLEKSDPVREDLMAFI